MASTKSLDLHIRRTKENKHFDRRDIGPSELISVNDVEKTDLVEYINKKMMFVTKIKKKPNRLFIGVGIVYLEGYAQDGAEVKCQFPYGRSVRVARLKE